MSTSPSIAPDRRPRVLTIDPGRPFLTTLARALLSGDLVPGWRFDPAHPERLADVTVLLPTRRAGRALRDALRAELLDGHGLTVAFLPDIRPFGDVDEDGDLLAGTDDDLEGRPIVSPLERRLAMARLVLGWTRVLARDLKHPATGEMPTLPSSPAEAVRLASSLLVLMDQVHSQGSSWSRLDEIVPEDHALYWQMTRQFLRIVAEAWPAYMEETGRDDPTVRRHAAVRAAARRLADDPPKGPVVAAGSTGSVPSTADLIAAVAGLEQGVVVLPGLDLDLDAAAWDLLEPPVGGGDPVPGHPQYGLRLLLDRLGLGRGDVERLTPTDEGAARRRLLSEALRPAVTTEHWRSFAGECATGAFDLAAALDGLALIEARNEAEEALAVALALREAIEHPQATAALVTPDRNLARRVAAELTRWGLAIDDSAGEPFGHTLPAVLVRFVGEVALCGFSPETVAGFLAHPLALFGRAPSEARRLARIVELVALRGPRPLPSGAGLLAAFDEGARAIVEAKRLPLPRARLAATDLAAARAFLSDVVATLAPLEALADDEERPLPEWAAAHVAVARAVARDDTGSDAALFAEEEGEALAQALARLVEAVGSEGGDIRLKGDAWPAFFDALLGDAPVNRRTVQGARLFIFGPLEARLLSFDLLVLAGLDEGIWPITTRSDPWLSRPMRRDMALEAPERRIGLSAHDFAQGAAAPRVILARAERSGGTPTVPSRWLQRLATVAGKGGLDAARGRAAPLLAWARALDRPDAPPRPISRPEPRPPLALRPSRASVTEVETWIRDPYAIFARRVLRLDPLDGLGLTLGAADRGVFVHAVLERFVKAGHSFRGADAEARLAEIADDVLADYDAFPEVQALWRPRLAAIGRWWLAHEAERDPTTAERNAEIGGRLDVSIDGVDFALTAIADRIDLLTDGTLAVFDYKTGQPPSETQVQTLLSPQLALEAAMVTAGGFDRHGRGPFLGKRVSQAAYLHLKGTGEGGVLMPRGVAEKDGLGIAELGGEAMAAFHGLVRLYRRAETGYPSRPRVQFEAARTGPYDHLARVAEWAAGEGGDGGEA